MSQRKPLLSPLLERDKVQTIEFSNFEVDCFDSGEDVVYHFYPSPPEGRFDMSFALGLENAYKEVLPEEADVRAEYIEKYELDRYERIGKPEQKPSCAFWIKVMGYANNPMASVILKKKLFDVLKKHLENENACS